MSDNLIEGVVVDKWSKPLTDLRKALAGIKGPNLSSSQREFERFREAVQRSTLALREGLGQAVSGLGVSSLGAVGGIAAVAAAIKRYAALAGELRAVSRETGVSAENLFRLQQVASQFGSTSESMAERVKTFAQSIYDLRNNIGRAGELKGQLLYADPSGKLLKSLQEGTPDQALNNYLAFLGAQKNPETAGRLSELLSGGRDFSRLVANPERAKQALASVNVGDAFSPENDKRVRQFADSMAMLNRSVDDLILTMGASLLPNVAKTVEFFAQLAKAKDLLSDPAKAVRDAAMKAIAGDLHFSPTDEEARERIKKLKRDREGKGTFLDNAVDALARGYKRAGLEAANRELLAARQRLAALTLIHGFYPAVWSIQLSVVSDVQCLNELLSFVDQRGHGARLRLQCFCRRGTDRFLGFGRHGHASPLARIATAARMASPTKSPHHISLTPYSSTWSAAKRNSASAPALVVGLSSRTAASAWPSWATASFNLASASSNPVCSRAFASAAEMRSSSTWAACLAWSRSACSAGERAPAHGERLLDDGPDVFIRQTSGVEMRVDSLMTPNSSQDARVSVQVD